MFGKIFDHVILEKYRDRLCTSELQFGFKRKSSTHACTMLLKEVLSYYANNQSSVYCTFLDVSKAFDRVQHCKLFRLLLRRNVPPYIVRVLLRFYIGHSIRISWNCVASDFFTAYNGVKQCGVCLLYTSPSPRD